jgi:hypothetical protein
MNTERINSPCLLAVEMSARLCCHLYNIPEYVFEMVQMISVRCIDSDIHYDEFFCQLFLYTSFKLTFFHFDIKVNDEFYKRIVNIQFRNIELYMMHLIIFSKFPTGFGIYFDQFVTPKTPPSTIPNGTINFWNDIEDPIINYDYCEEPIYHVPNKIAKNIKSNYFYSICSKCDSISKDSDDIFDLNMFCSDECRNKNINIFNN